MTTTLPRLGRSLCLLAAASLISFVTSSCAPKADQHLAAADRYFAAGDYDKAEIEYKNILQLKGKGLDPHAIGRLGVIYFEEGMLRQSITYLFKARELQPENLEFRRKISMIYLASGKWKEAKEEAEYILSHDPADENAPIVLVEASFTSAADVETARQRLAKLPAAAQAGAPVITALGLIDLRQRRSAAAEQAFKRALSVNPKLVFAQASLGALYRSQNDRVKAEQAMNAAADLAPIRSGNALQYAQFKIQTGDKEGGRAFLEEIVRKAPDYLPPQLILAEIAATEKRYDDSSALVSKILARDPASPEANLVSGRLKLAQGKPDKAILDFEKILQTYPSSAKALYFLGLAHAAAGEKDKAVDRLTQAIKISPVPEAIIALAGVNLRNGAYNVVIEQLKPLLEKDRKNVLVRMMLADAYRGQGDFNEALAVYQSSQQELGGSAPVSFQIGLTFLQQNRTEDARLAFGDALKQEPGYQLALEQLVNLDIADKKFDAAIQRLAPEVVRNPKSALPHLLLGRVYGVKGDIQQAEASFSKAIELRPDVSTGYFQLGQLYASTNQQAKALASLKSVTDRDPEDAKAWLMIGLLQDQQKDYAAARAAYEKILTLDPKSVLALNNLAYLYSERFNEFDKAAELAQKARELLPEEPRTADTLGWVLYKKAQYARSHVLLEESGAELLNDAEAQFHLGMARYMMGLEEPSRQAFQRALDLNKNVTGEAEIRRRLSILAIDGSTSSSAAIQLLEKHLIDAPADPVALSRVASLYEAAGSDEKAVASYQAAIKTNPGAPGPYMGLARLYAARKDTSKALEAAKAARKLAPDDPVVARSLGALAHQMGDSIWAASLLQEAVRKQSEDPELLYETAHVIYSIGRVDEATEMMTQALSLASPSTGNSAVNPKFAHAEQAKQFLEMVALSAKPDVQATARINAILKDKPNDTSALMALGAWQERQSQLNEARQTYEKVLANHSEFTPVKLRLAILALATPKFDAKAFEWAQAARAAYPQSTEAARALGIMIFHKGNDFPRVIGLLQQATAAQPDDAESLYYLGLAQLENKAQSAGRQALQKSIELGLKPDLLANARKKLEQSK